MAHNIEEVNGVYSFVENGRKERAWHELGQVFDGPMTVAQALELSHANYRVELQPLVALTPTIADHLAQEDYSMTYFQDEVLEQILADKRVTMRMDTMKPLGIVSKNYGVVQNEDAFKFIDMLVTGQVCERDSCPVIETAVVLGHGEKIFVTARFPEEIILDSKGNDRVEMNVVFTTSHDGLGGVNVLVTPVRVVCNNTLNFAMTHNSGRLSFKHTSGIMSRLDLMNKENAEFAYSTLNLLSVYKESLEANLNHLRNIRISEKQLDDILAEVMLSTENLKVYRRTGNLAHDDISTRGKNLLEEVRNTIESGVGQEIGEKGTGLWLINGLTSFYQNTALFRDEEKKFDSIISGTAHNKVQKAFELVSAVA